MGGIIKNWEAAAASSENRNVQKSASETCIHGAQRPVPEELHLLSPLTAQKAKAYQVFIINAPKHTLWP